MRPLDFPRRAYNRVYNEFYRDENLQEEVAEDNQAILRRAWEKDYFTAALPWQQRGTAPAMPISLTGEGLASWAGAPFDTSVDTGTVPVRWSTTAQGEIPPTKVYTDPGEATTQREATAHNFIDWLGRYNTVDTSGIEVASFNVADLRLAFQIQRWMERNARSGVRYTEFLRSHFAVSPRDDRLDRPEYIGGQRSPVVFSEVLQTSSTDGTSPQGNLAGHGIAVNTGHVGKYRAEEFGLIIGLLSVMPRAMYTQGIDRQWLRQTRYDFYFPEFANLSEQGIMKGEVFYSSIPGNDEPLWGYQGRYDEMRVKHSRASGLMRTTFDYWHLGREFASAPPLNSSFIVCDPRKDFLAVPSEPAMIISHGNRIRAIRPLPVQSNPGLIDH